MKSVKIAELKDRLSEHLRAVERGEEVIVTDRSRPIARIVPFGSGETKLTVDAPAVSFESVRTKTWGPSGWRLRATELVAEERGDK